MWCCATCDPQAHLVVRVYTKNCKIFDGYDQIYYDRRARNAFSITGGHASKFNFFKFRTSKRWQTKPCPFAGREDVAIVSPRRSLGDGVWLHVPLLSWSTLDGRAKAYVFVNGSRPAKITTTQRSDRNKPIRTRRLAVKTELCFCYTQVDRLQYSVQMIIIVFDGRALVAFARKIEFNRLPRSRTVSYESLCNNCDWKKLVWFRCSTSFDKYNL